MNAILVFDPSNDLVFAKSNKLFRKCLLKYSRSNGLLANNNYITNQSITATTTTTLSSSPNVAKKEARLERHQVAPLVTEKEENKTHFNFASQHSRLRYMKEAREERKRQRLAERSRRKLQQQADQDHEQLSDTSKAYMEILMLLLTPYVASLRINNNLSLYNEPKPQHQHQHKREATSYNSLSEQQVELEQKDEEEADLLSKFMSSINVNQETLGTHSSGLDNLYEEVCDEFKSTKSKLSSIEMPVECLKKCQIAYCELYDFIFIHMQHFEVVSSFKLRLLQKRIDFFAKLALFLFGPSLNSLRPSTSQQQQHQDAHKEKLVDQAEILRQAYDVWLANQFEPQFLLEANERLTVGSSIEQICQNTLQNISRHLRLANSKLSTKKQHEEELKETHMHALLYSNTKLISSFSCRNSQSLQQDDLILLLLLLKTYNTHHKNQLQLNNHQDSISSNLDTDARLIDSRESPKYCYVSHFNANKQTYQINHLSSANSSSSNYHKNFRASQCSSLHPDYSESSNSLPVDIPKVANQFLVFLSTSGKFKERLRVPHMLRFVTLTRGITMILISEISISYLSLQINRLLKIISDFNNFSTFTNEQTLTSPSRGATRSRSNRIKLSQLAKVNDCVCAIKSYFYGHNYDPDMPIAGLNAAATTQDSLEPGRSQTSSRPSSSSMFANFFAKFTSSASVEREKALKDSKEAKPLTDNGSSIDTEQRSIYGSLNERQRRQCCQLVCRLEDLVSSNVHTYVRQTFNMPIDDHRRDALLSSVSGALRESIGAFVLQPQVRKLNQLQGDYLKYYSELMDQVRLKARHELSDYLEYLAVKACCNVTLGPPLTHDMQALRAFIYVDRSRQELVASAMKQSAFKMDQLALLEADFATPVMREINLLEADSSSLSDEQELELEREESKSESDDTDQDRQARDADSDTSLDESESTSCSFAASSGICLKRASSVRAEHRKGASGFDRGKIYNQRASSGLLQQQSFGAGRSSRSQWLLGRSNDLATADETASSSRSSNTTAGSSSIGNLDQRFLSPSAGYNEEDLMFNIEEVKEELGIGQERKRAQSGSTKSEQQLPTRTNNNNSGQLVDENLIKGFTCFIYNRLANGQTSFSSSDGTYVYSYFLWFKRYSVRSLTSLPQVYSSLQPNNSLSPSLSSA